MLGSTLARARREQLSGQILVRDREQSHTIRLQAGTITDVLLDDARSATRGGDPYGILRGVERLFGVPRPLVKWSADAASGGRASRLDPAFAVVGGVMTRCELFSPLPLVERIPVETLRIDHSKLELLRHMAFHQRERAFLERLTVPTPIPMILWKRGLEPQHAGALIVALNLIGLFDDVWSPGDLPRVGAATRLRRKMKSGCSDSELLDVDETASIEIVDRAFRKISLELHPDRLIGLPEKDAAIARAAFVGASEAYTRIKRSRRSRPVRGATLARVDLKRRPADHWFTMVAEARNASSRGDHQRARAFALKALALSPPQDIRAELLSILRRAA